MPWIFALGVAAAVGVVALHLLSTQRPPVATLPTARFVPKSELRAVSRTSTPTDVLLLILRVLTVLAIAAAFAQPLPDAPGPSLRRIVALEWTSALAEPEAARAAALALLREGDALVIYDSAARVVAPSELATLAAPSVRRVSLSPMLVAVRDAAAQIARGADSLAVTVIGAFPASAWDAATPAWRAAWPGRIEWQRVDAEVDTLVAPPPQLISSLSDDPLRPAVEALSPARGAHPLRLRRAAMLADDSLWLEQTTGAVLISWPAIGDSDSLRPDGVLAVDGRSAALVAPLARRLVAEGRVIARWRDGQPAATERALGLGCLREIGIGLPTLGDVTLRDPFQQLLAVLTEPCGAARLPAADDSSLTAFGGAGSLAAASAFLPRGDASPLTPWLLALALVLLVAEQLLRRRGAGEQA